MKQQNTQQDSLISTPYSLSIKTTAGWSKIIAMSRLAKKDIILPAGVEATLKDSSVTLKGPLGTLARTFPYEIKITKEEGGLRLKPTHMNVQTRASWGTVASHIMNMIEGVTKCYQKKLLIEGTGFKWDVAGKTQNSPPGNWWKPILFDF